MIFVIKDIAKMRPFYKIINIFEEILPVDPMEKPLLTSPTGISGKTNYPNPSYLYVFKLNQEGFFQ